MFGLNINLLGVVVAALATFAVGALWYSPMLLGKQWANAHGYTPEKLEAMKAGMLQAYAVSFLCYLVMALVLAALIDLVEIVRVIGGIKLGALCWLGFAATIGLTANMFSEKPLSAYLIDAGYQLVYLMVMGGILAAWS